MNNWKLLTEEKAEENWNESLIKFDDCSPFQTYEWGQYNKALGWKPLYFAHFDEDENVSAMALILLKKFFLKTGFVWIQGGPVGEINSWNDDLREKIINSAGLKRLYMRFRSDRPRDVEDKLLLLHKNWTRTLHPLGSSFSMELDLSEDAEQIDKNFRGSWRRQLKLSGKNPLTVKQSINPDIKELHTAFGEMEAIKGLPELFSIEKLENLFQHVRSKLIFFRCEDEEGNLLSFRAILFIGHRAVEYMGATNDRGRELRASFPLEREVLRYCREKGITKFDLGGIDPFENPGCHRFKRGTGGEEVEYLGEWDWGSSFWLRLFGNLAIQKRAGVKQSTAAKKTEKKSGAFTKIYQSTAHLVRTISGLF